MEAILDAAASSVNASTGLTELFSDLVRCETRLYNALNEALRSQHGIAASQFEFLRFLQMHPHSRVADLAEFFAVGVGATSKGMDRLESVGYTHRIPNPSDRRSSLIELTAHGAQLLREAEGTFQLCLNTLIAEHIGAESVDTLRSLVATLRGALEKSNIGIPVG